MARDVVSLHLRMSKSLHRRLQKMAERHGLSLNSEIIEQLEGRRSEHVQMLTGILRNAVDQIVEMERAARVDDPDIEQADFKRRKASETPDESTPQKDDQR